MADQARDLANLKLQMDALQKSVQNASLPEAFAMMRSTMKWSAMIIAAALLVSSIIRLVSDNEVRELRRRVEKLENHHAEKPLPAP